MVSGGWWGAGRDPASGGGASIAAGDARVEGENAQKNTGPDDAAASRMTFWDVDGRAGDGCELEAEDVGRPCASLADTVENAVKKGMVGSERR